MGALCNNKSCGRYANDFPSQSCLGFCTYHLHHSCLNSSWRPSFTCSSDHLDQRLHPYVHMNKSLSVRLEKKSPSHSPHSHFLNFRVESGAQHTCQGFLHRCEGSATSSGSLWLPGKSKERAFLSSNTFRPSPTAQPRTTLFERQENEYS